MGKGRITTATSIATPLAIVIAWVAESAGIDMPETVAAAIGSLIMSVTMVAHAVVVRYVTPRDVGE